MTKNNTTNWKPRPVAKKTQHEKDLRTSIWFTNRELAIAILIKIQAAGLRVHAYIENNLLILNRDLSNKEYKIIFPSKE